MEETESVPRRLRKKTGGKLATPRDAWCGWDLGDPDPSKPSTLPQTLSRARKMTVTAVIAGQVKLNLHRTPESGRDRKIELAQVGL